MAGTDQLPARASAKGITLAVRLTPKASADSVVGIDQGADGTVLRVRVRAVPDRGKANQALIKLLAHWLGEPPSRLRLTAGGKSRGKQVLVEGEPEPLMDKLRRLIETLPA